MKQTGNIYMVCLKDIYNKDIFYALFRFDVIVELTDWKEDISKLSSNLPFYKATNITSLEQMPIYYKNKEIYHLQFVLPFTTQEQFKLYHPELFL